MKIKGQLEWTDYMDAQLLHFMPSGLARIGCYPLIVILTLGLGLGITLSLTGNSEYKIEVMIPAILFLGFILLYRFVLLPRQTKRIFLQQKELNAPFEIDINGADLVFTNEFGTVRRPWANFVKWKEDQHLFMLYHSDVAFTMLPKRFLTDGAQVQTIRDYLKQNKVPSKVRDTSARLGSLVVYVLVMLVIVAVLWSVRMFTEPH